MIFATRQARVKGFSHYHLFSRAKTQKKRAFSKCYTILNMRLQLMWIESVLGHSFLACNLLWPCFLIETSDTDLSGIH